MTIHTAAIQRTLGRLTAVSLAIFDRTRDLNQNGYHNVKHMQAVAGLVTRFGLDCGLSDTRLESLAIAAWLHDFGHHAHPDTVLNDRKQSINIETAVAGMHRIASMFPQYDWPVIETLVRATQWPHSDLIPHDDPEVRFMGSLLRDADVLSGLLPDSTAILLSGLRNEMMASGNVELPKGPQQLEAHARFMSDYAPLTPEGEQFFHKHFEPALNRWAAYLEGRDGGTQADYQNVIRTYALALVA